MVLKLYEDEAGLFSNPNDAIAYMHETNFRRDVTVYDIDTKKAEEKARAIYDAISKYNKGKPLNTQIFPTNTYSFRGILGCLGVQCYNISLGTYEKNHRCLALFTGFNRSVLDTSAEPADIRPSLKALYSLAMILSTDD